MKLIKQKIWVEVDVKKERPKMFDRVFMITNENRKTVTEIDSSKKWDNYNMINDKEKEKYWLKPIEDKYMLSDLELRNLWNAACEFEHSAKNPDFDEFIHSLI